MDIRQQLLLAFEAEHREHLDAIRVSLAAQASGRAADWNDVFRRAHSLKGASRAVDLPAVENVAHRLETLFERVSSEGKPIDRDALDAVNLALDRIEAYVADMKEGSPVMSGDAIAALDACLSNSNEADTPDYSPAPVAQPQPIDDQNSPDDVFVDRGQVVLRIPAATVHAVTDAAYGLANAVSARTSFAVVLAQIGTLSTDLQRNARNARAQHGRDDGGSLRADLSELEAGLAALTRLTTELGRSERSAIANLEAASSRVREEAERLALVPAESAFGGFARALREMARDVGQEVDIDVRGLDLPVDRALLQVLRDPVLHGLRNALSHGAESEHARRQACKPPALRIVFEIAVRGSMLIISIHDDGRGLDLEHIEARARQRGLLQPGETVDADRLSTLVFEPGFSTATSIDTLSGRGIGLAVVAEAAQRLQGAARLSARTPHGASLVLRVPLAASRRPILIVEAGSATYGIPSAAVERLLQLKNSDLGTAAGRLVAHVTEPHGTSALPVVDLGTLLGSPTSDGANGFPGVLLRVREQRCVVRVAALADVRTLLVLPPPPIGIDTALIAGVVVLGDREAVLVLDPEGLIERSQTATRAQTVDRDEPHKTFDGTMVGARRSTILVVDDSITTRTLEKSILEAAGYRVVVCVDGLDALDHLRTGADVIDLVVADVEMPRLDGFGLVKALRSDASFAELPVILMTSRGASEDIARGLQLGADAYLTKQKFDQRELLDTIGQLL